jgi:hypothetical protein
VAARLRIGACLSLTGKFARFGRQAATGLDTWQSLTGVADVLVEDDGSDRHQLRAAMPSVAACRPLRPAGRPVLHDPHARGRSNGRRAGLARVEPRRRG